MGEVDVEVGGERDSSVEIIAAEEIVQGAEVEAGQDGVGDEVGAFDSKLLAKLSNSPYQLWSFLMELPQLPSCG